MATGDMASYPHWSRTHVLYSWYRKARWRDVKLYPNKNISMCYSEMILKCHLECLNFISKTETIICTVHCWTGKSICTNHPVPAQIWASNLGLLHEFEFVTYANFAGSWAIPCPLHGVLIYPMPHWNKMWNHTQSVSCWPWELVESSSCWARFSSPICIVFHISPRI